MLEITPVEHYRAWVKNGRLEANPEQEAVLQYLTSVREKLLWRNKLFNNPISQLARRVKSLSPVNGLYLWGGVGVGKTMIMDYFYETLPVKKMRLHFHAFMRQLHQQLRKHQGERNPLTLIGAKLAAQYGVICLDEFLVTEVADAMLLTELFKSLFKGGVSLVTTANLAPEQLYADGLQRERFLPVIQLMRQHTQVWHLALSTDYRRRPQERLQAYYTPLNEASEQALWRIFRQYSSDHHFSQEPVTLCGRQVAVKQRAERAVWFEFSIICGRPRSQDDYLALANQYPTVLISHVPRLDTVSKDQVIS